ncbi:hypothetical protein [Megamonas funiformis]|uniref:hypothetical protein n=1 Tax=Megamonas funiformis TaxID=437897 RepID=UPI0026DBC2E0|nr:hypothetical protein [Megamonas funiformis]
MGSICSANPIHDLQDEIPTDKALHFAAGYIISDQLQRNVDNNDAYATMTGSLFYQIKF